MADQTEELSATTNKVQERSGADGGANRVAAEERLDQRRASAKSHRRRKCFSRKTHELHDKKSYPLPDILTPATIRDLSSADNQGRKKSGTAKEGDKQNNKEAQEEKQKEAKEGDSVVKGAEDVYGKIDKS
ncbi:MAG: hypothetical protein Q9159_006644 [Coniocarpon cinnabarinum]